jgi:hypothetical protein
LRTARCLTICTFCGKEWRKTLIFVAARRWQKGYYEHVLRDDEDSKEVAFYIIANPVRAGLARSPDEYPFSGSDSWLIRQLMEWVTKG